MTELFNLSSWLLDRQLEAGHGERLALRDRGHSYDYAALHGEVCAAANALRELGARPGERVVLVLRDTTEFVAAFLGAVRIGAIPVPVNPLLPPREAGAIAALAEARLLLTHEPATRDDLVEQAPGLKRVVAVSGRATTPAADEDAVADAAVVEWEELLERGVAVEPHPTTADSPAFWLCTSGSTGRPKLVMHRQLSPRLTSETYAREVLAIDETDRCYSVGPLFHAYGLGNSITFPLAVGASAIVDPTRPPTPDLISAIARTEEPSLFFCIPTVLAALVAADIPDDSFRSVRLGVSAAEPLAAETWRAFRDRFGVEILDGIGSTEALHIFISNRAGRVHPGTSGTPVPGYEARLVDDAGATVEANEAGHLEIRGASFASGYWRDPEESRDASIGEWMPTGDLYTRSDEGVYTYLGRSDDMLRVGGEWVSPAEVEGVLIEHPAVLEAAVVGRRDELGTQRPIAFVTLVPEASADPDELRELCGSRLAGYKRPREIHMVDELPKTTTGKIQRFRLRAGDQAPSN